MPNRREVLASMALFTAGLAIAHPLRAALASTAPSRAMLSRSIPGSGERLPVIGMGTSGSFEVGNTEAELAPLREVLRRFFAAGASVIDTAPSYGQAEAVMGRLLEELDLRDKAFLATKISSNGRDAGLAQFERSLALLRTDHVELLQVHSLQDWQTQMALIEELKKQGKTRYSGVTHWLDSGHEALTEVVTRTRPDFLQINYSVISRGAEDRLFPLAQELGVAVLVNRSFDDGRLFAKVAGKPLPGWAAEAGISSWAQAFLRFSLSHPAVTALIPATGKPERQSDNLLAGHGEPLTAEQRRSLIEQVG